MNKLSIVKIGHPVLREKAQDLPLQNFHDPKFQKFLKEMVTAMHQAEGVGLAANQVGSPLRALVMECKFNSRYPDRIHFPLQLYVNAKIVHTSKDQDKDWEGCLSIPGYRGVVSRSTEVTFEAFTPEGKPVTKTVSGFEARVIQHEVDHLNGMFYMDRMPDLKGWVHLDEFNKMFESRIREGS